MALLRHAALAAAALALAHAALVAALPLNEFMAFGPGTHDDVLPVGDDEHSDYRLNAWGFKLFGSRYNSIVVHDNGFLYIGENEYSLGDWRQYEPYEVRPFPFRTTSGMIAPLWTDYSGGELGDDYESGTGYDYRRSLEDDGDGEDQGDGSGERRRADPDGGLFPDRVYYSYRDPVGEDADRVRTMLEPLGVGADFMPKFFFVATWYRYAGYSPSSWLRNTFQAVLAADEHASYVIFHYERIDFTDGTRSSGDGQDVEIGFDEGKLIGGGYYVHPASWNLGVRELNSTSNVGVEGRWAYRVDNYLHTEPSCNDVVLAGDFTSALSSSTYGRIMQYSCRDDAWQPLPDGFNGAVHAVAYYRGYLYAGGEFTADASETTELRYFARWDGAAWSAVPGGLEGPVYALTEYKNKLLVGGDFVLAYGSVEAARLATWDGRRWRAVVEPPPTGAVRTIVPFLNGELLIGGEFEGIGETTGIAFAATLTTEADTDFYVHPPPALTDGPVRTAAYVAMNAYTNFICLGGAFASATGSFTVDAAGLACVLDGYESNLIFAPTVGAGVNVINTMVALRDGVIVGGSFLVSEEPYVEGAVGLFNLTSMTMTVLGFADGPATAFRVVNQALWVFGPFWVMDGLEVKGAAAFTFADGWSTVDGLYFGSGDGAVLAAAVGETVTLPADPTLESMVLGGEFDAVGGRQAKHVLRYVNKEWVAMGAGFEHDVRATVVWDGLVVASSVDPDEGMTGKSRIAYWDGHNWVNLGNWPGTYQAYALADYNGVLFAAGYFRSLQKPQQQRRDGDHQPQPRAEYPSGPPSMVAYLDETLGDWRQVPDGPYGYVYALAVYDGVLVVGGNFGEVDSTGRAKLVTWDGAEWGGLAGVQDIYDGYVTSLLVADGVLYVGGSFHHVVLDTEGTVDVNHIMAWNGTAWDMFDGGLSLRDEWSAVTAMAWFQDQLFVSMENCAPWYGYPCLLVYDPGSGAESSWVEAPVYIDGTAYTLQVLGDWLYIAGDFNVHGTSDYTGTVVARYNGTQVQAIDKLYSVNHDVYALLVLAEEDLVIGGGFTKANSDSANNVAIFLPSVAADGRLRPLNGDGVDGRVEALGWFNGMLLAGGDIEGSANNQWFYGIARFVPDLDSWAPVIANFENRVYAILGTQDCLYLGGDFTWGIGYGFAKFADGAWRILPSYPAGEVYELAEYTDPTGQTLIYVGGSFDGLVTLDQYYPYYGSRLDVRDFDGYGIYGIATWDDIAGEWYALGEGVSGSVYALAIFQGELWVGGEFYESNGLLRWNGTEWLEPPRIPRQHHGVTALGAFDGFMYAAIHWESQPDGNTWALLRSDGASPWAPMNAGGGGTVTLVSPLVDGIVVGGSFDSQGAIPAHGFTRWNGQAWSPVDPVHGDMYEGDVLAMIRYNGKLVVGGEFETMRGVRVNNLAIFDGEAWRPVRGGVNGRVWAMAIVDPGILYVAGDFSLVYNDPNDPLDSTSANGLTGWIDTNNQGVAVPGLNSGFVYALAEYNGYLYVGGDFYDVDGVDIDGGSYHVLQFEWGVGFSNMVGSDPAVQSGPRGTVYALAVLDSVLYAVGSFSYVNDYETLPIAMWDGQAWSAHVLGDNFFAGSIYTIASYHDELYIGGGFFMHNTIDEINTAARFDGQLWRPLTSPFDGTVKSMIAYLDLLYIGGSFFKVGALSAKNIVVWNGTALLPDFPAVRASEVTLFALNDGLYVGSIAMGLVGSPSPTELPLMFDDNEWRTMGGGTGAGGEVHAVLAPPGARLVLPPVYCPETIEGNASWPSTSMYETAVGECLPGYATLSGQAPSRACDLGGSNDVGVWLTPTEGCWQGTPTLGRTNAM